DLIQRVRYLEPVSCCEKIEVECVSAARLKVDAIKYGAVVADVMNRMELRRVEEMTGARTIQRQKIARPLSAKTNARLLFGRAERTVMSDKGARRLGQSKSRFSDRIHDKTGLLAKFSIRRA